MRMKNIAFVAVLLVSTAHAELYKCPSLTGSSYQETPCAMGGLKIDVEKQVVNPRAEFERAISLRQVRIGMTESEVIRAWRRPDHINTTRTANYVSEQWVYERASRADTQYLYFTDGILESLQSPNKR